MATTYPTSKQDLDATRGTDNQRLDNPNHATHHSNEDDTIEALQDKVGIDNDTNTSSHDYKLSEITSTDKGVGKTATQTLTNKTLTSPKINVGSDQDQDIYKRNSGGDLIRLPKGNANELLGMDPTGTTLQYNAVSTVTTDEKNALAGTSGTPSASNKYVTNDDTATSGNGKVLRLDGSGDIVEAVDLPNNRISGLTFGEAIDGTSTPQAVAIGDGTTVYNTYDLTGSNDTNSGTVQDLQYQGQTFITSNSFYQLNQITLYPNTVSASGNIRMDIYLADGSHKPTGGVLATKTESITTTADKTFTFASPLTVTPNTEYCVVLVDTTTAIISFDANLAAGFGIVPNTWKLFSSDGGSSYTANQTSGVHMLVEGLATIDGQIHLTSAGQTGTINSAFVGFHNDNTSKSSTGQVITGGVIGGFSGLNPGSTYYLSDTYGAISTSAGTNSVKVGVAISTTQLLIKHDNS